MTSLGTAAPHERSIVTIASTRTVMLQQSLPASHLFSDHLQSLDLAI